MGPSGKLPTPSLRVSLLPFFLDLKTVWQKTLLITFFLLKKKKNNSGELSQLSVHLAWPSRAGPAGALWRCGAPGTLGAVGLLLLEQGHGQLRAAPQPLQVAEAAAVVEFLTEPRAAVPQGELLHQPWLHGPEKVEP